MHILTGYNRDTEETFGVRRHYVSPVTEVIGFKSQGLMSWSVPDIPVNPPEDPKNPDDPTIIIDPSDDYGGQIGVIKVVRCQNPVIRGMTTRQNGTSGDDLCFSITDTAFKPYFFLSNVRIITSLLIHCV